MNGYKHQQNIEVVEYINIVEGLEGRFICAKLAKKRICVFLQLIRLFILSHYQVALLGRYLNRQQQNK